MGTNSEHVCCSAEAVATTGPPFASPAPRTTRKKRPPPDIIDGVPKSSAPSTKSKKRRKAKPQRAADKWLKGNWKTQIPSCREEWRVFKAAHSEVFSGICVVNMP